MALRLPSQNKAFRPNKPNKPRARPAVTNPPGANAKAPIGTAAGLSSTQVRPVPSQSTQGPPGLTQGTEGPSQAETVLGTPQGDSTVPASQDDNGTQNAGPSSKGKERERGGEFAVPEPRVSSRPDGLRGSASPVKASAPSDSPTTEKEDLAVTSSTQAESSQAQSSSRPAPLPAGASTSSRPSSKPASKTASNAVPTSTAGPSRARQPSEAPSNSSVKTSKGGRLSLLGAAKSAASSGMSKPSPGRLPSRSRSASVRAPSVPPTPETETVESAVPATNSAEPTTANVETLAMHVPDTPAAKEAAPAPEGNISDSHTSKAAPAPVSPLRRSEAATSAQANPVSSPAVQVAQGRLSPPAIAAAPPASSPERDARQPSSAGPSAPSTSTAEPKSKGKAPLVRRPAPTSQPRSSADDLSNNGLPPALATAARSRSGSQSPTQEQARSAIPPTIDPALLSATATNGPETASSSQSAGPPPSAADTAAAAQAIIDGLFLQRGSSRPAPRPVGRRASPKGRTSAGITTTKRAFRDKTVKGAAQARKRLEANGEELPEALKRRKEVEAETAAARRAAKAKRARSKSMSQAEGTPGAEDGLESRTQTPQRAAPLFLGGTNADDVDMDDDAEDGHDRQSATPQPAPKKKRGRPKKTNVHVDDDAEVDDDGEPRTKKARPARPKKAKQAPAFTQASLQGYQAGDILVEPIDVNLLTMSDLATNLTTGQVAARGVQLDAMMQDERTQKRLASQHSAWNRWVQAQLSRRKVRRDENAEREKRRQVIRERGGDPTGEVTEDEPDSEEEFQITPNRYTPPPEEEEVRSGRVAPIMLGQPRGAAYVPGETPAPGEGGDDDGEGGHQQRQARRQEDGYAEMDGQVGQEENFGGYELQVVDDEPERPEDDLAAAGFLVADDDAGAGGDDNEEEYDYEAMEEDDGYDLSMYRAQREAERERMLLERENREVIEENDDLAMINQRTYSKAPPRGMPWTQADMLTMYMALSEVGPNSDIVTGYFPGRTRKQVNRKMVKEQRAFPDKFWAAVANKKDVDVEHLKISAAYDDDEDWSKEDAFLEQCQRDAEACRDDYVPPPEDEQAIGEDGLQQMDDENEKQDDKDDGEYDYDAAVEGGEEMDDGGERVVVEGYEPDEVEDDKQDEHEPYDYEAEPE